MGHAEIAHFLSLSEGEARRHLHFLEAAGIVDRGGGTDGKFSIARRIQPMVHGALEQVGALKWR
jgi:DNA-binding IclR family transcriptional regulator